MYKSARRSPRSILQAVVCKAHSLKSDSYGHDQQRHHLMCAHPKLCSPRLLESSRQCTGNSSRLPQRSRGHVRNMELSPPNETPIGSQRISTISPIVVNRSAVPYDTHGALAGILRGICSDHLIVYCRRKATLFREVATSNACATTCMRP